MTQSLPVIRGPLPAEDECAECPLAIDGKPSRPVKGIGPIHPKFIVIGEGPGVNEVNNALPFIGKSGSILNRALSSAGVAREEIYITNTTLCLPPREKKEEIVHKAAKCCRARLMREIDDLGPDPPILAVGKHAASELINKDFKITELAGTLHTVDLGHPFTKDIVPTIHPAAMLRGSDNSGAHTSDLLYWFLQYDVAKISALADGKVKVFTDDIEIETENPDVAHDLILGIIKEAELTGWLACDLETKGVPFGACGRCYDCLGHSALEATFAQITALGLSTTKRAISINWQILKPETLDLLRAKFADKTFNWTFHNRGYDEVVLEANGFPIAGTIDCTLYMHHNVFPGLPHKLQRVASQFMLIGPWKAEFRHGEGSLEELLRYNARDTLVTARIRSPLLGLVEKRDARKTYDMDMRKCAMAKDMQINGIPLSLERNAMFERYFTPKIEAARKALLERIKDEKFKDVFKQLIALEQAKFTRKADADEFGLRMEARLSELEKKWAKLEKEGEDLFNLNSPPQLVAYLKACGVNLTVLTKKGKLSTKKDVLEQLVGHPAVRELLEYRANEKLCNTFVIPLRHRIDKNGRLHPTWSPNKMTGRFGSSPNMQNLTKGKTKFKTYEAWAAACEAWLAGNGPDPDIPNLRWQFMAPEGYVYVGADFSALEARVVAMLANDEWLCGMFINNSDVHSYFAAEIFPEFSSLALDSAQRKQLRDLEKRALYGYLYGAAEATVWKALTKEGHNIPISTISRAFRIFAQKMPKVLKYYANLLRETIDSGKVNSFLLGRAEYFPLGGVADDPTVVKNFVCQAGGADIADTGIVGAHEALKGVAWTQVHAHDAGYWLCKKEDAEYVKKVIEEKMTQTYEVNGVSMLFAVEADIGDSLGAA